MKDNAFFNERWKQNNGIILTKFKHLVWANFNQSLLRTPLGEENIQMKVDTSFLKWRQKKNSELYWWLLAINLSKETVGFLFNWLGTKRHRGE